MTRRHGKDFAAEYIKSKIGMTFESSSYFAAKHYIFPSLREEFGYTDVEQCFADRHSDGMRERWFNLICDINKDDPTTLSTDMFNNFNCYVGLRNSRELLAAQEKWPELLTIWIDASERFGPEDQSSCTVTADMADIIIKNNDSQENFCKRLDKLCVLLAG